MEKVIDWKVNATLLRVRYTTRWSCLQNL